MVVMELSQLSDSEQFELALFGPHSTPCLQPHGSDFEQPWPLPPQFGPPVASQNFPHAAHCSALRFTEAPVQPVGPGPGEGPGGEEPPR